MKQSIPLHTLKEGEHGTIVRLCASGKLRRRLQDIGMIEGARIGCVQKSLWGNPVAYQIRGAVIALRTQDAARILVTPVVV
ncbi:MAG: ferrous iron transport protein A [Oscillospiraceae bacterium]|nr:ferrous iron transport protein A [Oscillospiraceae bacterium]